MIALFVALAVAGQTAGPSPDRSSVSVMSQAPEDAKDVGTGVPAPAGRLDATLKGLGVDLAINNDTPEIALNFARRGASKSEAGGPDGLTSLTRQTLWSASLSVPVGGKDSLVDPQTLDKLSIGPTVAFAVSQFATASRDSGGAQPPNGTAWNFGLEARLGFNRFDYREPVTLAERSSDKFQYSATGLLTFFPTDRRSLVTGAVEVQHAFKAQDDQILCKPTINSAAADCVKASPGLPIRDDGVLVSLEYRRTIGIGWSFADLAISPKATVDALDGDIGLELPVYLLPLADGAPILPGIKLGYASEKNEVIFGMFLKSSFKLRR